MLNYLTDVESTTAFEVVSGVDTTLVVSPAASGVSLLAVSPPQEDNKETETRVIKKNLFILDFIYGFCPQFNLWELKVHIHIFLGLQESFIYFTNWYFNKPR